MTNTPAVLNGKSFEDLKMTNENGIEYWSARDLMPHLDYKEWRNFSGVIEKAKTSCERSGNLIQHHFVDVNKMVLIGSGNQREQVDFQLSRFACYLIAQNGDPKKPRIAEAQKYFVIQTRRSELSDELEADLERLETRQQTRVEFKALSGAAQNAGVQNNMFGVFHDAGYKGLYGDRGSSAIKSMKGVPKKENLMDRMGTTELAANQFRMTQAREKLSKEGISDQQQAITAHKQVGKEVRAAIERINGTMPEDLRPEEHIKKVEKRIKGAIPKLKGKDAKGLTGE
ncbi:MAG: DNA damage-inducible protein D [Candidatus Hatepunaea meridiana]|nr:DNA damage-inducible protein D [Candidatus Hatepunaea meridiana]